MSQHPTHFYDTSLLWEEKRRGTAFSPGLSSLRFATPPEFKGEAGFWSPETLFVLAAETCLMATFVAIAEISKVPVRGYSSSARGKLEWVEGEGYRFSHIEVRPVIELENEADRDRALRVLEKAEKNCLITRSLISRITIEPEIRVLAPVL